MPQIQVRRLHYRGAAALAGRVEHAVGDALRTETTDDGRLILVRRLPLGRVGVGERGAQQAAARAWRELVSSARHGGESGAESANCVWFASPAEARALMLRELARGRTPFAWFWTLAVPDWQRMSLAQYLAHRLALALADPTGQAIAALADEAQAAGVTEALAGAIVGLMPPEARPAPMPVERSPPAPPHLPNAPAAPSSASATAEPDRGLALALLGAVPAPLRAVLERLAAQSGTASLIEALARGLVQRQHPALALAPRRLAFLSRLIAELLRTGESRFAHRTADLAESRPAAMPPPGDTNSREPSPVRDPAAEAAPAEPVRAHAEALPATARGQRDQAEQSPPAPLGHELPSSAAGLFLVLVPLIRLGWREWLAERPDCLAHQPGARLLHTIARHHRVPPGDALWSVLHPIDLASEPPAALEAALTLWRKALDGWLRRKARLNLAELVLRRGWLLPGPDTTIARFPLNGIDIRLRRLALDSDPGWVDWLGHSYRLVYRDRPLTGPQMP